MNTDFSTKELKKCANDVRYATRTLGKEQADIFFSRLGFLYSATTFEDLRNLPGHFHELKYDRKGQWAFDLKQPYRMILTPKTKPIPVDNNGGYIWDLITDAVVVEIENYHKEK